MYTIFFLLILDFEHRLLIYSLDCIAKLVQS